MSIVIVMKRLNGLWKAVVVLAVRANGANSVIGMVYSGRRA